MVAHVVRDPGAVELLTSRLTDVVGSPAPFYARLGFAPPGELDSQGETILRLDCERRER